MSVLFTLLAVFDLLVAPWLQRRRDVRWARRNVDESVPFWPTGRAS